MASMTPAAIVLDAGPLIGLERASGRGVVRLLARLGPRTSVVIPATVLAQVWRSGRQARLARLLGEPRVRVAPMDEATARLAGTLLGRTATSDITDAHVVIVARQLRSPVITSAPGDLHRLDSQVPLLTG